MLYLKSKESKENGVWKCKKKEAILSSKGQITVPKVIRELLHVENGDSLVFYIEDDEVKLTNISNLEIKLKDEKKKAIVRKEK